VLLQLFDGLQLAGEQQFRRLFSLVNDLAVPDPAVNLCAYLGVDGIDGNGDMGNPDLGQLLYIGSDCHTV